jgi:hypothetical protein
MKRLPPAGGAGPIRIVTVNVDDEAGDTRG